VSSLPVFRLKFCMHFSPPHEYMSRLILRCPGDNRKSMRSEAPYYISHTDILLGLFPFKVQLFQGCKSETEPINTKSVVQHVCQVTLSTSLHKYCCYRATCLSGHVVDFTTQVLLLSSNMFVRSHCRLHYTSIVAVVQHVCQVTLSTSLHKYCCRRATCYNLQDLLERRMG
jgi:hypothetical protein